MNDPNGFHHEDGKYRLFYQYHDLEGDTSHISWRLSSSLDLVAYEDEGVKLRPRFPYEGLYSSYGGCWSGSFYHGPDGDYLLYAAADESRQSCCLAKLSKDGSYHQIEGNPIALPPSFIEGDSFRDPFAFSYKGRSYFIIGAMDHAKHGKILLYELRGEEAFYKGMFHEDDDVAMFECPCLLFLGDEVLLVSSPMGLKKRGLLFQNAQNNIGMFGHIDEAMRFVPRGEPFDLDFGFDYYAAQGCPYHLDASQAVMTAWLSLWGKDFDHKIPTKTRDGYLGAMALPRLLSLEGGKLVQRPYPSAYSYFGEERPLAAERENTLSDGCLLSFLDIEGPFSLSLLENPNGRVVISYDGTSRILEVRIKDERVVAREGLYGGEVRKVYLEEGLRNMEVFIDYYIVEVFLNGGRKAGSLLYWGNEGEGGIARFQGKAKALLRKFSKGQPHR